MSSPEIMELNVCYSIIILPGWVLTLKFLSVEQVWSDLCFSFSVSSVWIFLSLSLFHTHTHTHTHTFNWMVIISKLWLFKQTPLPILPSFNISISTAACFVQSSSTLKPCLWSLQCSLHVRRGVYGQRMVPCSILRNTRGHAQKYSVNKQRVSKWTGWTSSSNMATLYTPQFYPDDCGKLFTCRNDSGVNSHAILWTCCFASRLTKCMCKNYSLCWTQSWG